MTTSKREFPQNSFHGILILSHHHSETSGFKKFIQTVHPSNFSKDISLARLRWVYFKCSLSSHCKTLKNCSTKILLEWLSRNQFEVSMRETSYNLYNAVYAVAYAFHEMLVQQIVTSPDNTGKGLEFYPWQMGPFLENNQFINPGDQINMNQKGKLDTEYDILYIMNFLPGLGLKVKIGRFSKHFLHDMDQCMKCPIDQYAKTEQTHCLKKVVTFLVYEDPLGMALACLALCFSALTAVILGVFLKHQDTPIVKANNRVLSYQTTFAIVFTVAVSTILAKTITVVMAFKVTDPRKKMRWLLLSGTPNYIIPICTMIQLILCGIWLGRFPSFVDMDLHFEYGHIIIVCNKGSVIAF
ncbi:hypothetical protein A6R68_03709 [Neotoma lepida]|uniref:G-protein coupled receptors family 3 profile domain-containing protein n=1 Tax=Neotoma lepida TaxID=56216 RepID=A0A1A6GPG0_NEOLE|nr:hypothetical protein A6R68_03709 [Neotoma lepida]